MTIRDGMRADIESLLGGTSDGCQLASHRSAQLTLVGLRDECGK